MLNSLEMDHFKGFKRFTVHFPDSAYIVGPNNAGKSTLVQGLRACAHMLRYAKTRAPQGYRRDGSRQMLSYALADAHLPLVAENIRHEFMAAETRISLVFANRARLTAVWPTDTEESEPQGFFYLETADGRQPRRPKDVLESFPRIGVVPSPSPLEHTEVVLNPDYVKRNEDGKLSSRHFRNQLYCLKSGPAEGKEYNDFLEYVSEWTPELRILSIRSRPGARERELDVFYEESGSRIEKEIVWSGDGLQVWLQLLFHLFRCRNDPTVVLDEPDVYLHADLQRRLVRVLETHRAQTVLATHSAEVLGEAPAGSVVWVDRSRRHAVRAPDGLLLEQLTGALGSQFNMRLARALRAKVALFFEGDDHRIIRALAKTLGAVRVAQERGVALVPIGGFSNWDKIEPFVWLVDKLLERSVAGFVVLDRDYRPEEVTRRVEGKLVAVGLHAHVWRRKELESYLLVPSALARVTGASEAWVKEKLFEITASLEATVFARGLDEAMRHELSPTRGRVDVTESFKPDFEGKWADHDLRLQMCPAKLVISRLNEALTSASYRTLSIVGLARSMLLHEIPDEMRDVIWECERVASL